MLLWLLFAGLAGLGPLTFGQRQFAIDYDNNQFLKDGKPFRYISGSIHYFRLPEQYWYDRLYKMKAAGLNAIQFYIPWNFHELSPGVFDFTGQANVTRFLEIANKLELLAILRVGPYSCGEWEYGGFPWWLALVPNLKMRTSDPKFLTPVTNWYKVILPILAKQLYKNGGPIIMVQIENEYGSFAACDHEYMHYLRDQAKLYLGNDTVIFTTDGAGVGYLRCGAVDGAYATVDFGTTDLQGVNGSFQAQRVYAPKGPLVNSEFYPGWLDDWGLNWSTVATPDITTTMHYMWQMNASFNFYMFYGGTNFGYTASGMGWKPFMSVTTSYDYDAPLTEAGDPTPKYAAIRETIENLTGIVNAYPMPTPSPKQAYGLISFQNLGSITWLLNVVSPPSIRKTATYPLSMEAVGVPFGFIMYETNISFVGKNLSVPGLRDRGYVLLDGNLVVVLGRDRRVNATIKAKPPQKLQILVENQGRDDTGRNDPKGIIANVTLDNTILTNWLMYPIDLSELFSSNGRAKIQHSFRKARRYNRGRSGRRRQTRNRKVVKRLGEEAFVPSIYYGFFPAQKILDTYFNPDGWQKGQLFINGYNVGRYWPSFGPQVTLYVPKWFLRPVNHVILFELEGPGLCKDGTCHAYFTDQPYLNRTVQGSYLPDGLPMYKEQESWNIDRKNRFSHLSRVMN